MIDYLKHRVSIKAGLFLLMFSVVLMISNAGVVAKSFDEDLLRIALNVFPKMVAVDQDITEKLTSDGKIQLVIFYRMQRSRAEDAVQKLKADNVNIAGFPVEVVSSDKLTEDVPTAVMLVEKFDETSFRKLLDYCIANNIMLFSPFEEDVRRGATAGISVEMRIKPYFNKATLEMSNIKINEIVLRSSRMQE